MTKPTIGCYNEAIELAVELNSLLNICLEDTNFWSALDDVANVKSKSKETLTDFILLDCLKCYHSAEIKVDLNTRPCLALSFVDSYLHSREPILREYLPYMKNYLMCVQSSLETLEMLWNAKRINLWGIKSFEDIKKTDFIFSMVFAKYSENLKRKYYGLMYRLSLLAIQQNHVKITFSQSKWMADLFQLYIL